jgi:hypothetical protein
MCVTALQVLFIIYQPSFYKKIVSSQPFQTLPNPSAPVGFIGKINSLPYGHIGRVWKGLEGIKKYFFIV